MTSKLMNSSFCVHNALNCLQMLLLVGDSFAAHLGSRIAPNGPIQAAGWRGACVGREDFRRWVIGEVAVRRPDTVIILAGGNDLARPDFRQRSLAGHLRELALGVNSGGR